MSEFRQTVKTQINKHQLKKESNSLNFESKSIPNDVDCKSKNKKNKQTKFETGDFENKPFSKLHLMLNE